MLLRDLNFELNISPNFFCSLLYLDKYKIANLNIVLNISCDFPAQVAAYYHKVQTKFASNRVPNNKFVQFRDILQAFDPTKETPIDLYMRIEELFGEEHKYLADEFLMFLTPGQAVEMGRFMDYFTMVQLSSFVQMLKVLCQGHNVLVSVFCNKKNYLTKST